MTLRKKADNVVHECDVFPTIDPLEAIKAMNQNARENMVKKALLASPVVLLCISLVIGFAAITKSPEGATARHVATMAVATKESQDKPVLVHAAQQQAACETSNGLSLCAKFEVSDLEPAFQEVINKFPTDGDKRYSVTVSVAEIL